MTAMNPTMNPTMNPRLDEQHGYTCKKCDGPAPMGVGYVDESPNAYGRSLGRDVCPCGYSRRARPSA